MPPAASAAAALTYRLARQNLTPNSATGRVENVCPSGYFRDALCSCSARLCFLAGLALSASLQWVSSDMDGRGNDPGVFLFQADPLVGRHGCRITLVRSKLGCLVCHGCHDQGIAIQGTLPLVDGRDRRQRRGTGHHQERFGPRRISIHVRRTAPQAPSDSIRAWRSMAICSHRSTAPGRPWSDRPRHPGAPLAGS
jgi:hypothetical protein